MKTPVTPDSAPVSAPKPMRKPAAILALLLFLSPAMAGCFLSEDGIATLWTDNREILFYCELFNSSQNRYRIEVVYKDDPAQAILAETPPPDLVVGDKLRDPLVMERLISLGPTLLRSGVSTGSFLPVLLNACKDENRLALLPLSYNLSAVIFPSTFVGEDFPTSDLSLDQIKEYGATFNEARQNRWTTIGFSPFWDPDFVHLALRLMGANFRYDETLLLTWDDEALAAGSDYLRTWTDETNGDWARASAFQRQYYYGPAYRLVLDGRILFSRATMSEFNSIPGESLELLDFRWISHNERIPIDDEILCLGIPRGSGDRSAVAAFLAWFFKPENQQTLVEEARQNRIPIFGIADGFSSITAVNQRILPNFFPYLVGHIPQPEYLDAPPTLPWNWERIRDEVFSPWYESGFEEQQDPLRSRLDHWRDQAEE